MVAAGVGVDAAWGFGLAGSLWALDHRSCVIISAIATALARPRVAFAVVLHRLPFNHHTFLPLQPDVAELEVAGVFGAAVDLVLDSTAIVSVAARRVAHSWTASSSAQEGQA